MAYGKAKDCAMEEQETRVIATRQRQRAKVAVAPPNWQHLPRVR